MLTRVRLACSPPWRSDILSSASANGSYALRSASPTAAVLYHDVRDDSPGVVTSTLRTVPWYSIQQSKIRRTKGPLGDLSTTVALPNPTLPPGGLGMSSWPSWQSATPVGAGSENSYASSRQQPGELIYICKAHNARRTSCTSIRSSVSSRRMQRTERQSAHQNREIGQVSA